MLFDSPRFWDKLANICAELTIVLSIVLGVFSLIALCVASIIFTPWIFVGALVVAVICVFVVGGLRLAGKI